MTAPSEKQIAILNKYHKPIPGTIQEASQIISQLFGKKEEKKPVLLPNESNIESNSFKEAYDAVCKYAEVCKFLGYEKQYWNLSTVWNTERLRNKMKKIDSLKAVKIAQKLYDEIDSIE